MTNLRQMAMVITVYGLALFACVELSLVYYSTNPALLAVLYGLGLFFWTFIEYFSHRYVLHDDYLDNVAIREHGGHHNTPDDTQLIATPFVASTVTAVILLGILGALSRWLVGDISIALGILSGTLSGYLFYETVHFLVHTKQPTTWYMKWCKKHHWPHHFGDDKYNYGVTSPIWDILLRTDIRYRNK